MFDFAESLAFLKRVLPSGDGDWYCVVGLDINAKESGRPKSKQLRVLHLRVSDDLRPTPNARKRSGWTLM